MIRLPRRNPEINADYSPRRRLSAGGLRLNFSDQQRALGELNRAVGQGPRYVEEDVSSGVKAVAKGVQNLSGAAQELILRNQDITDKRKLYDNETKLAVMQEELQGKLTQENDPNKWESLAAEHMAAAQFDTEGMSPAAIQALKSYAERTKAITVARARNGGFAENERRLGESVMASIKIHTRNRNIRGIAENVKAMVDDGHWTPEVGMNVLQDHSRQAQADIFQDVKTKVASLQSQGRYDEVPEVIQGEELIAKDPLLQVEVENMLLQNKAAKEEAEFNNAISSNPREVLDELNNPEGKYAKEPGYKKQDMAFKAQTMIENKSALSERRATSMVAEKTITSPEQLDQPEFKDLTPEVKQTLKQTILWGPPNSKKEWMSVMIDLNSWKPSADSYQDDIELNRIENMVGVRFTGAYKDQLVKRISEIRSGPDAAKTSAAKKLIADTLKTGGFGVTEVPYVPKRERGLFGLVTAEEGTALSPADQVRTGDDVAKEDRIKPKDLVIDRRKQAAAQKKAFDVNEGVDRIAQAGGSEKDQLEYVRNELAQYQVAPALDNKEKNIIPVQQQPLFNSLPQVDKFMQERSTFKQETDSTQVELPPGLSPELNTPNPLLPPPTK